MKNELMNNVTRTFGRLGLKVKKHSPEILLVSGLVAGGAALVAACRATTKLEAVLSETKGNAEQVHECAAAGEICIQEGDEIRRVEYTEEDSKKDLTIIYAKGTLKVAKLYAPAIGLGAVSLVCILASHGIIHKRNTALAAAYTAVDTSFKEYRQRVVERFGAEMDRELKYNIKAKEVEETVVQEDGTETVVKKTVNVVEGIDGTSEYARFFDEWCKGWTKDAEANLVFLRQVEAWANQRLKSEGHLFLNELYDALGIQRTKAGQIVGWVYDLKNPKGDNRVDLGIYNVNRENCRDFVNGREISILIDPNVDGVIYDLIG
jgi:hypothetical protein